MSGKRMADELAISGVAIWKHIEALRQEGYDINGVAGRGYRLNNWQNVIIPSEVMQGLGKAELIRQIMYCPVVDSTNELAKELAASNEEGLVIVAGQQRAGKGRLGRKWDSPLGGIWFSIILKPRLPLSKLALLSLVFALALGKALDKFTEKPSQLKWPNDVFIADKKVAGILLEVSGQPDRVDNLIAGFGINVNISSDAWVIEDEKITSLLIENHRVMENSHILTEVLSYIEEYYYLFLQEGFEQIRQEFKAKCLHLGQDVSIQQFKATITGRCMDIDEQGSMILKVDDEIMRITTGDVKII